MKFIGSLTSALVAALAVIGGVVVVKSLPDIRRYLEMRRM